MILHREFNFQHRENFEVLKLKEISGLWWDVSFDFLKQVWSWKGGGGQTKNGITIFATDSICDCSFESNINSYVGRQGSEIYAYLEHREKVENTGK